VITTGQSFKDNCCPYHYSWSLLVQVQALFAHYFIANSQRNATVTAVNFLYYGDCKRIKHFFVLSNY